VSGSRCQPGCQRRVPGLRLVVGMVCALATLGGYAVSQITTNRFEAAPTGWLLSFRTRSLPRPARSRGQTNSGPDSPRGETGPEQSDPSSLSIVMLTLT